MEAFLLLASTTMLHCVIMLLLGYVRFKRSLHAIGEAGTHIYHSIKSHELNSLIITSRMMGDYTTTKILPHLIRGFFSFKPWWKLAGFEEQPSDDQLAMIILNNHTQTTSEKNND